MIGWKKTINKNLETVMHYIMSFVGGYMGIYAMLLRGGNFGSAQTANLIKLFMDGMSGHRGDMLIRLGALIIFSTGLVLSHLIHIYLQTGDRILCILLEVCGVLITACLPLEMNDMIALYPLFFITAFQWGTFSGTRCYGSATTFSTNNLRQMLSGWVEYLRLKDPSQRDKALFYTMTLVMYHLGVLAGFLAVARWMALGILGCLIPLGAGSIVILTGGIKSESFLGDGSF